MSSVKIPCIK